MPWVWPLKKTGLLFEIYQLHSHPLHEQNSNEFVLLWLHFPTAKQIHSQIKFECFPSPLLSFSGAHTVLWKRPQGQVPGFQHGLPCSALKTHCGLPLPRGLHLRHLQHPTPSVVG